ncbi:hypothetical protein [Bacillus cereus]|nr:hypothetical protein [Bacillus cereus]
MLVRFKGEKFFNKNAILVENIKKDPIRGAGPFNGTIELYGIANTLP